MELVHEDLQCGAGQDYWPRLAGDAVPRGIKRPAAALILSRLLFDAPRRPTEPLQSIQSSSKVFTAFRNCSRLFETSSTLFEEGRSKLFKAIRGRSKLIGAPRTSPLKFILERLSKLLSKPLSKLVSKPFEVLLPKLLSTRSLEALLKHLSKAFSERLSKPFAALRSW